MKKCEKRLSQNQPRKNMKTTPQIKKKFAELNPRAESQLKLRSLLLELFAVVCSTHFVLARRIGGYGGISRRSFVGYETTNSFKICWCLPGHDITKFDISMCRGHYTQLCKLPMLDAISVFLIRCWCANAYASCFLFP